MSIKPVAGPSQYHQQPIVQPPGSSVWLFKMLIDLTSIAGAGWYLWDTTDGRMPATVSGKQGCAIGLGLKGVVSFPVNLVGLWNSKRTAAQIETLQAYAKGTIKALEAENKDLTKIHDAFRAALSKQADLLALKLSSKVLQTQFDSMRLQFNMLHAAAQDAKLAREGTGLASVVHSARVSSAGHLVPTKDDDSVLKSLGELASSISTFTKILEEKYSIVLSENPPSVVTISEENPPADLASLIAALNTLLEVASTALQTTTERADAAEEVQAKIQASFAAKSAEVNTLKATIVSLRASLEELKSGAATRENLLSALAASLGITNGENETQEKLFQLITAKVEELRTNLESALAENAKLDAKAEVAKGVITALQTNLSDAQAAEAKETARAIEAETALKASIKDHLKLSRDFTLFINSLVSFLRGEFTELPPALPGQDDKSPWHGFVTALRALHSEIETRAASSKHRDAMTDATLGKFTEILEAVAKAVSGLSPLEESRLDGSGLVDASFASAASSLDTTLEKVDSDGVPPELKSVAAKINIIVDVLKAVLSGDSNMSRVTFLVSEVDASGFSGISNL
ncbi:MAG: hypothetical protein KR126chlam1_00861 [Chlamydiae bacterium]|nr:hypothetical protein [Chlamydiota bacterium]